MKEATKYKLKYSILLMSLGFLLVSKFVLSRPQTSGELSAAKEQWATGKLNSLSLKAKVGQMIMPRFYGVYTHNNSKYSQDLQHLINDEEVGGFILSNWFDERGVLVGPEVYETAYLVNKVQRMAKIPLLFAADFERGAAPRIRRAVSFPENMAFGAAGSEEYAYFEGKVTAQEARALGIHWTFAPIADVNNNPNNPIINTRSYGEDPQLVARLVSAYVRGAQENGIIATAKHFPGHGDTATDSHTSLAVIAADKQRLKEVELVPFNAAIDTGVGSIMTAHITVPNLTEDRKTPATLSHNILTDLLRKELAFNGIIVTDALEMGGITTVYSGGEAAVRAVKAGADMVLLPSDPSLAISSILNAVKSGDIPEARIDTSVSRILNAKARVGLDHDPIVKLEQIDMVLADEANKLKAQEIADRSMTLVKNQSDLLPVSAKKVSRILSLVVTDERDADVSNLFQKEVKRRVPSANHAVIDQRSCATEIQHALAAARRSDLVLCSVFSRWRDRKGTVAVPKKQASAITRILQSKKSVILTSFGSPYIVSQFPQAKTYLCAYGIHDVSQMAAVKAIFGEIDITGKLPVSLPRLFPIGHGLKVTREK